MAIEYKLSEESAKASIEAFLESYDLSLDDSRLLLQVACTDLIRFVRMGRIEIDVEGDEVKISQNLRYPTYDVSRLEYKELNGGHKLVVSKKANPESITDRQFVLLAALSGEPEKLFHKLKKGDLSAAEVLGTIFLLL